MGGNGMARSDLITTYGDNSPFAEAYRILRNSLLEWQRNDRPLRTLGITGARPGHGSTTVAANLGLILGETRRRTIVVDGDLYRPSLHTVFKIPNEVGLSSVLQGEVAIERALQEVTDPPVLRVLPAGPPVRNPAALMRPDSIRPLLEQLQELTDIVIVDLPSVSAVAYTSAVASALDGLLLVVRAESTSTGVDRLIKKRLHGVNVMGMVLNQLPITNSDASSYRHYHAQAAQ